MYVPRDSDQPTYLAPGEAARYRQVIAPFIARRMLLPEGRDKPIDLEIHDFEGHSWRLANTESPTTLGRVSVTGTLTPPARKKYPFLAS